MSQGAGRWNDLNTRLISAAVLIVIALLGIMLGGVAFALLLGAVALAGLWEIWRMQRARLANSTDRLILIAYGGAILVACLAFLAARLMGNGLLVVLYLVAIVVTSDVAGYFAGRLIGGPKFWPRVSPKKTWSGTVAGWLGAALVGVIINQLSVPGGAPSLSEAPRVAIASALLALAAQMGDIAESAIKRRAGVKDSSGLIPGHGGVLDRFDGMIGVGVVTAAFLLLGPF